MLEFLLVQVFAGVGLVATVLGSLLGTLRRRTPAEPEGAVTRRSLVPGTQTVWIVGTLVAVFWPAGVLVVPRIFYDWPAIPGFPYAWAAQLGGILLAACGGVLFVQAARALGEKMTPVVQVRSGSAFVQSGPYRYVRHPVYTAIVAVALGNALLFVSAPLALLGAVLAGVATYRARAEEDLLGSDEGYGAAYREYVDRTGRFLPRRARPPRPPDPGPTRS
ncbi:MAG TPA: isoprenylcysteine carboxylmethyltransferase family protein [Thermoplasmata archaeon]|nr:isoprenylcysteine carboxylmethyltransferase family protein [Thermoplasmata archaeon]